VIPRVKVELAEVRDAAVPRPEALCARVAIPRGSRLVVAIAFAVFIGIGVVSLVLMSPGSAVVLVPIWAVLVALVWRATGRQSARRVALAREGRLSTVVVERAKEVWGQHGSTLYEVTVGIDQAGRPAQVTCVVANPVADEETCTILHMPGYPIGFVWCGDQPGVYGNIRPRRR
jgi:hypothetical protein